MSTLRCGDRTLNLDNTHVMGILNVTPDSFSDGGVLYQNNRLSIENALVRATAMVNEGATIIDIGGESTRPGAVQVGEQQELDRVLPVVEALNCQLDIIISIDTSNVTLMREAIALGAGMINDVRALTREGAIDAVAGSEAAVCLMHMQGDPRSMQHNPHYTSVTEQVSTFLMARVDACKQQGIPNDRIVLDPGFGFGKRLEDNLHLLADLPALLALGYPLLSGTSRKSMIGQVCNREVGQRLAGSVASALLAAQRGARIVRVHDVAETVDALKMMEALMQFEA